MKKNVVATGLALAISLTSLTVTAAERDRSPREARSSPGIVRVIKKVWRGIVTLGDYPQPPIPKEPCTSNCGG
jgi:hypothetical protein